MFEVALRNGTHLRMYGIELDCDCRMYWIIRDKEKYSEQVVDAKCSDDYDMFIANRDEFSNCTMI